MATTCSWSEADTALATVSAKNRGLLPPVALASTASTAATTTAATATTAAATTATASTTTATAATTAEPATSAASTVLALFGLIDAERATVEQGAVHLGDGLGGLGRGAHRHEREATGLARFAVRDDVDVGDLPEGGEGSAYGFSSGLEGEVPDVEAISHRFLDSVESARRTESPDVERAARHRTGDSGGASSTMMHHSGLLRGSTGIPFILSGSLLARGPAHAPLALLPRTGQRALVKRAWLLAAALLLVAPRALAHPAGRASVNRYLGVERVGRGALKVAYLLDFAETPAYAEIESLDADHDGEVTPEEQRQYLRARLGPIVAGLVIELGGVRLYPVIVASHVETPPGEGGLSTVRIAAELEASGEVPPGDRVVSLYLRDDAFADRPGWRQMSVPGATWDTSFASPRPSDVGPPRILEGHYLLHGEPDDAALAAGDTLPDPTMLRWVQGLGTLVLACLGALLARVLVRRRRL